MKVSKEGIKKIFEDEGFRTQWYDDWNGKTMVSPNQKAIGFWTIGFGTLYREGLKSVLPKLHPDTTIDEAEALRLAKMDLKTAEDWVNKRLKKNIPQNQFNALVSHTYNTGGSDNLMKLVNFGGTVNFSGKTYDLREWWLNTYITNASTKKIMQGLVNRRKREFLLFMNSEEQKKKP